MSFAQDGNFSYYIEPCRDFDIQYKAQHHSGNLQYKLNQSYKLIFFSHKGKFNYAIMKWSINITVHYKFLITYSILFF